MLNNVYLFETGSKELFISAKNHKRARIVARVYQPKEKLYISKLYGTTTNQQEGMLYKSYTKLIRKERKKDKKRRKRKMKDKKNINYPEDCNEDTGCDDCKYLDEETLNCNLDVKEE